MISLKTKISTPNWRQAVQFYKDIFCMIEVEAWDEPGDKGVVLAFGNPPHSAFLEIYASAKPLDSGAVSLQVKVADVDAFIASLPNGIDFEGPAPRPWGARYVFMVDPSGTEVVIFDGPTY